jgi:hypothetical protein
MSAFSTGALSRRPHALLILVVAIACAVAVAVAIVLIAHGATTSHLASGTSVFVRHHPHSNAGYGLNARPPDPSGAPRCRRSGRRLGQSSCVLCER